MTRLCEFLVTGYGCVGPEYAADWGPRGYLAATYHVAKATQTVTWVDAAQRLICRVRTFGQCPWGIVERDTG